LKNLADEERRTRIDRSGTTGIQPPVNRSATEKVKETKSWHAIKMQYVVFAAVRA
jgi:hypothetical protein